MSSETIGGDSVWKCTNISAPNISTNPTRRPFHTCSGSTSSGGEKCSGRTPTATLRSVASEMFIDGEPMNPATNRSSGRSYNACGDRTIARPIADRSLPFA